MIVKDITDDLINMADRGEFDVIAHGSNCQCNQGAGIAYSLKMKWREIEVVDKATIKCDITKMGDYSKALVTTKKNTNLMVYNAYTQFRYGRNAFVDLDAVFDFFTRLNKIYKDDKDIRIGIPMIGSGYGKGNWSEIVNKINQATPDIDITLVRWERNK